jgi:hypothetical protein
MADHMNRIELKSEEKKEWRHKHVAMGIAE